MTSFRIELDPDNSEADRRGARVARDPAGGRWFLTVPDDDATATSVSVYVHEFWTDEQTDNEFAEMSPQEVKERLLSFRGLDDGFGLREVSSGQWHSECGHWTRSSAPPMCLEKLLRDSTV